MSERPVSTSVRGFRLGGPQRLESENVRSFAPRVRHLYVCALGHQTTVVFHAEADPPVEWDCDVCPAPATYGTYREDDVSVPLDRRTGKTHWEQLQARRTEEELEALLQEALSNLRRHGKAF